MISIVLHVQSGNIGRVSWELLLFSFLTFGLGTVMGLFFREVHEAVEAIDTQLTIELVNDKPGRFTRWVLNMPDSTPTS